MKKSRTKKKNGEKWKSIKINKDTYLLIKQLSLLLDMNIWKVALIAALLLYALITGRQDIAHKIIENMKKKYIKRKELLEELEKTLEQIV